MIKQKDLVPGKVITSAEKKWTSDGNPILVVTAWMIVGFQENVKRRHSKAQAPREGWHVLLLRFGGRDRIVHDVVISPNTFGNWKRLF